MGTTQTTEVVDTTAADAAAVNAALENEEVVDAVTEPQTAEEDEYDKLFAERVAKREAEKNGEVVEPPAVDAKKDEVVVEAAPTDAKKDAPKVDEADALLDTLPEAAKAAFAALREKNAKLDHDNRSMAGRVSAYQRKYEDLKGKAPAEVVKAATDEQQAEWTQFAEDYPDIAKAISARLEASQPGQGSDVATLAKFVEDEMRTRKLNESFEAVEVVHPGWRDKIQTTEFAEWQKSSPTYERLASSDDIADAIALVDLYDAHRSKAAPTAPAVDPKQAADAAKLAARRGAQAEGAKAATTISASPNASIDLNSEDQIWRDYSAKANARMKARNQ